MFYYLNGTVAHKEANLAVIDCGGVGYACRTTTNTLSLLNLGEKAKLYTYLNTKEDAFDLYGFSTAEELNLFRLLIGVSGVGPKAGLAILSSNTPANLAMSIITGDERALTCAPGVGKKIAQRVILELKDKLAKGQVAAAGESYRGSGVTIIPENKASEAAAALAVLGYSREEINAALRGIDLDNLTLEQMAHFLRPLGGLTKVEVREIAAQHGFLNARKRDSQDICFVPNGDYGGFIEHFTGTTVPCGNYIDRDGNVLGTHKGHIRYTLGQRKNLNIALGKRAYVVDKDVNANTVTLGDNDELYANGLVATDLNLIACDHIHQPLRCTAKTRHTQLETPCTVEQTGEDELLVRFDTPVRAVTPGQAVVLYDGDVVLGGGTIVKPWNNDQ